jgi:MerR family mercuric resistance operon transcriptional regulator
MSAGMTIAGAAHAAGVNIETIRYYHRRGLLPEPPTPATGYRTYTDGDVRRVRFIKHAKQLGFSLADITSLLTLEDGQHCAETRHLAEHQLGVIRQRIDDLDRMRRVLEELTHQCAANRRPRPCPIISALAVEDAPRPGHEPCAQPRALGARSRKISVSRGAAR